MFDPTRSSGEENGVNSELGPFFEGRHLDVQKLLRALYDVGHSPGPGVKAWVDGRELVFSRAEGGRGFMRLIPLEAQVLVAFPRGGDLFDPLARLRGPPQAQKSVTLGHYSDIDPYLRRIVEQAYHLD